MKEHNLAPLAEIERQIQKQEYGSLNLTLEVFQSKIVGVQGQQFQSVNFKQGENTEATSLLLSEIKDLHTKQESGMFTFTVKLNQGDIRKVYLQRNLKKQYLVEKQEL